ncbi:MAG: EF-hand domain-containing protein [Puia sp.]|nr:EF-hand domain-containing protein [Puia sp.]
MNHDGYISYEEFVLGVRKPMNERRISMVEMIFKGMDKAGTGKVAVGEIGLMWA